MIDAKLKGEGIELVSERGQDDRLLFYLPRDSFREICQRLMRRAGQC
jgi:hypothetical protein